MYKDYYQDVYHKDIDRIIEIENEKGEKFTMNELDASINSYTMVEKCKIKVAQLGEKLIGFMIYQYAFDSILLCRGIYFIPEYRKNFLLRRLIFSVGNVCRVFSTTHISGGPVEIQGEKPNRKLLHKTKDMIVWENIIRGTHGGSR